MIEGARACEVTLDEGDLLNYDVSSADVVYIHATCFTPQLLSALALKLASELKTGRAGDDHEQTIPGRLGVQTVRRRLRRVGSAAEQMEARLLFVRNIEVRAGSSRAGSLEV